MKLLKDEVHVQRGEAFTLDFQVTNRKGDPFMLFSKWANPFLVITVASALYKQEGDYRKSYWLDLKDRFIEQADGTFIVKPIKKFISTEALYLYNFSVNQILATYIRAGADRMVLDKTSDFDITNFLFYVDVNNDGNRVYKYLEDYAIEEVDGNITVLSETWVEYSFRIVKQFDTRDWIEQKYMLDIKVVTGQSIGERITEILTDEDIDCVTLPWGEEQTQMYINEITNENYRTEMQTMFIDNVPLYKYTNVNTILPPTPLYVGVNLQGGNY